jgi:diguanylate cyclase (GGDEF)-like protein
LLVDEASVWDWIRRHLADLRIGTKIAGASIVGSLIFAALGGVGQVSLQHLADQQGREYRTNVRALDRMTSVRGAISGQQEAVLSFVLSGPGSYRDSYASAITSTDHVIDAGLASLGEIGLSDDDRSSLSAIESDVEVWRSSRDVALQAAVAVHGGDRQGVLYTIVRLDTVSRAVKQSADYLLERLVDRVADGARVASLGSARTAQLMLWLGLAGAVAALVLSVLVARGIARPLAEVVDVLTRVASGDLSKQVGFRRRDEIGRMGDALNETLGVLRRSFDEVHHKAMHDSLTGLANRGLLRQRLAAAEDGQPATVREPEAGNGGRPAVILLDLDSFKQINDLYGHAAGDHVLVVTAERLLARTGPADTVARLGGDEFAILVSDLPETVGLQATADELFEAVEAPTTFEGRILQPRASVGATLWREGESADAVFREADEALYLTKAARKGIPADKRQGHEAAIAVALPGAVLDGQFRVLFQPLVALSDRQLVAVEALVRWSHPQLGLISPAEFIPVAESTGIIDEIGLWVLEQACRQCYQWREDLSAETDFYVSVNVSPRQLRNPALVSDVLAVLERTGLDPRCLALEVTESAIVDGKSAISALAQLRTHGVRIAIDDFGTGYSSLHYLTSLPLDIVKIDRGLVQQLDGAAEHAVIIEAVVHLGSVLHFTTVAEGVETTEQADELQALGCSVGQGFLWAEPVPACAVPELLIRI